MKQEDIDALENLNKGVAAEDKRHAAVMREFDGKIRAIERCCDHKFPDGRSAIYNGDYDNQCDFCGCEGARRS